MISQEVIDGYLRSECLNPVKVFNKYTNDVIYVPCGHCYSCLKNKSNRDTALAMNIASNFKYCYFVWLSYEDQYLPCMELKKIEPLDNARSLYFFSSIDRNLRIHIPNGKDRIITDSSFELTHPMTSSEYQDIIVKSHGRYDFLRKCVVYPHFEDCDNRIPYCNTSDCQKFLKRLRFHSKNKFNEEIRFYSVSEYGPRTYRPHWHLLLFFNSDELTSSIQQLVSESWSYGRTSCTLSRGGTASYVASYVNSNVCLPSLYIEHKEIRARSFHSKGYGNNHVFPSQATVHDLDKMSSILLNGESISFNGKAKQIYPSRSYRHTVFPRFSNLICKSPHSSSFIFSAAFFAAERLVRYGYLDITYDKSISPVSQLAHAYTKFFLDREDKGFTHFDDELIVTTVRLDAPNRPYWLCLTYDQIYSKFYRLFNMVIRSARFWNLFDYVDTYHRSYIYSLMEASDNYWNEFARRRLSEYFEFLENCNDSQRSFLFHRSTSNEVLNSQFITKFRTVDKGGYKLTESFSEFDKRTYSYDSTLSQKFLEELTATNRKACVDKVKHKEFNDLSGLLLNI
nr:MAG: replication initiator protein [Microvirus sp.]